GAEVALDGRQGGGDDQPVEREHEQRGRGDGEGGGERGRPVARRRGGWTRERGERADGRTQPSTVKARRARLSGGTRRAARGFPPAALRLGAGHNAGMADTEFWRDLKPITSVFKADARPEVYLADAPTEDERYYVPFTDTVSSRPLWISPTQ